MPQKFEVQQNTGGPTVGQATGALLDSIVGTVKNGIHTIKTQAKLHTMASRVASLAVSGQVIEYPAEYATMTPEERGIFLESVYLNGVKTLGSETRKSNARITALEAENQAIKVTINELIDKINQFEIVSK